MLLYKTSAATKTDRLVAIMIALIAIVAVFSLGTSGELVGTADQQQSVATNKQPADLKRIDDLISDFIDEAGERLKKNRLNSMRQVKQTLRFGRRSDPWPPMDVFEAEQEEEERERRAAADRATTGRKQMFDDERFRVY